MTQTRLGSLAEALINVLIGFGINFIANLVVLPMVGFHISLHDNFVIGCIYTAISVVRSYAIRRWFNQYITRAASALASLKAPT